MLRASEHKDNDVATIRMLEISSNRTIVKKGIWSQAETRLGDGSQRGIRSHAIQAKRR